MSDLMNLGIVVQDERAIVSSRDVARVFEKEHHNVLRDIENLECSFDFRALNFECTSETIAMPRGGKKNSPIYLMTRDGFTFLAMGFTGEKAARFKEAYIAAFNAMEAEIRQRNQKELSPKDYATALRALADEVEKRELAENQRDYNRQTKAEIGSRREATAMATASAAVRKVSALEDKIGEGKNYKAAKAIPWVLDIFASSRGMWSVFGKRLAALSVEMGYTIEKLQTSEFDHPINVYHVDVAAEMYQRLLADPHMMHKYRREAA